MRPGNAHLTTACAIVACAAAAMGCSDKGKKLRRGADSGPAVVVVDRGAGGAPIAAEREPNDQPEEAQPLPLPGGARGTIGATSGGVADQDRYSFEVATVGTLALTVSGVPDLDLMVDLHDATGKRLAASDNKIGLAEGFPDLTLQPGKYTAVVREFVKKASRDKKGGKKAKLAPERTTASAPYMFEVAFGPPPAAGDEIEPDNDLAAFAGALPVGGAANGFLGWRRDRDVWKVPLEGVGDDDALSVDVDGVAGVALRVAILDGTEAVLLERQGRTGEALSLKNVAVRAGEPHYYVAISGNAANLTERYAARVTSAPFQLDEEAEPNDTAQNASPLSDVPGADSGTRVGFLGRGDVDLYQLEPAPGPRLLQLTLEPPPDVDAVLEVVNDVGTVLAGPENATKRGGAEKLPDVAVPAGAVVYVKASLAPKAAGSTAARYRLRWSAVAAEEESAPVPGIDE